MKCTLTMSLRVVLVICLLTTVALAQAVPAWQNNTAYIVGDHVTFNGQEFRCQIAHTSQLDWTPPAAQSLWVLIQGGAQDFTVSATPAQQSVTAGNAISYAVSVAALNGFNGAVSLSVTGLPSGATARFNPSSINASGSSTLTISTATTTPVGNSTLTITGKSGALSHNASVMLTVNPRIADFSVSASPASQTVAAGGNTTYVVSVTAVNGFNGTVSLSLTGLPGGASASFRPTTVNGSGSSTLTVSTTAATPSGASTLTVRGASGNLSHTMSVTLNVGAIKTGTTGTIRFHLLLGVPGRDNPQDSLTLDGDNYTDLIMSNMIAGVMFGHMVQEYAPVPGVQFNKDYLYGSVMGQLLQENISTQEYQSGTDKIDPAQDQQAVMGAGQGGPYQINSYTFDAAGGPSGGGHSLVNYIAIQKNIGFTIANSGAQLGLPTPLIFNNKFYGPMLPAYFHYNDFVALNVFGKAPEGAFTPNWQPQYDQALANFVNLPNSFLDIILNEAYNQGPFGGLVAQTSKLGATATTATVATVNAYTSVWGNTSTFVQYPYQVHYYLDQMYDNPIPTTAPTTFVTPANHIFFNMTTLENVFSSVFQTLAHSNGTSPAQFFTATQAQTAFNSALATNSVSTTATLDLSNATDRAKIFAVIDNAISNLEAAGGMKFNATTTSQL